MDRRKFLETSTLGSAALATSSFYSPIFAQNQKLKIGLIGCGWYGGVLMDAAFKAGNVEVTGLCDVDTKHLSETADKIEKSQGSKPKTFKNYQDLLDMSGLQAVFIATPPHWHALQFIDACEKGLPIYCEKPLCYDVREGQAMVQAAEKNGNLVQIGFQRRQSKAFHQAGEYIQAGKAGNINQIAAQIHFGASHESNEIQEPPASLDWDMWCGPAPKLPYTPNIGHLKWRLEKEYGHGHLVDWGIHNLDITRVIMQEKMPKSFQAFGGIYEFKDEITTPDTLTAQFEFANAPVVWQHRIWGAAEYSPDVNNGVFFYGDKATVFASDNRWIVIPRGKNKEKEMHEAKNPDMQSDHVGNFLDAVRGKGQIDVTTREGFYSTANVQLAAATYETRMPIKWNMQEKMVENNSLATQKLLRNYRYPYKHPFV